MRLADPNADGDSSPSYPDSNSHAHAYPYANADARAYPYANKYANAHSDTPAIQNCERASAGVERRRRLRLMG